MKTRLLLLFLMVFSFAKAQVTAGLIQQFKFDNSYANVAGTTSFSTTSFDYDRSGYPNSAIRMTYALQSQATIPGLPYGNAARTISFWVKSLADGGLGYGPVFSYGTGTTGNAFGGGVSTDRTMMVSHNDDYTLIMPGWAINTVGVWYHFVMTYDGTTAKMYRNGELMGSMAKSWNTINNSDIFKLGVGTGGQQWFNGLIDDLKIYDRAVTDAEALAIYNEPNSNTIGLIKSFSFNNTAADDTNSVSFTTSNATYPITYTPSRNGAGQAMVTTSLATRVCTIPNLPLGKRDRTISFWCNHTSYPLSSFGSVNYGGSSQYNMFGGYLASTSVNFQGFAYDQSYSIGAITPYTWYFVALVFENDNAKVFINGQYFGPVARPLLNTTLTSFKIGAFDGAIDDLKIYDRALSYSEILGLYSKPAVTVSTYPATHDSATINYLMSDFALSTTSLVRYGLSSSNLTTQVTGRSTSGNGNVNASVGISGLLPNTTYYFQVEATNSSGTTTSSIMSFTTESQAPAINTVTSSSITSSSASVNYSVSDKGLATTSVIKYGLTSGSLTNQVTGFSASGNTTVAGNASITGLTPNTTYYYQVEATNSFGTSVSTVQSFTTLALPMAIAEYTFDNTYNNINGNIPFTSTPSTSFVNDRAGQSQKALRINTTSGNACAAAIPSLPIGNNARTVSLWYKTDSFVSGTPAIFSYGSNGNSQYFGQYINTSGNIVFWSYVTDYSFGGSYPQNTWRHAVFTYDGANVKAYINGVYLGQQSYTLNTGNAFGFKLGSTSGAIEVDDLKIYNYALSQSEVSSLYNTNTLSTTDFSKNNLQASVYPNPTNDILNIQMEKELKTATIYTVLGNQVLVSTDKQINVSSLSSGNYFVRIEAVDGAVTTQKIIIK